MEVLRRQIVASATGPFGHARYPLADTMDHAPDPGLFGPGSVSWEVVGDPSVFLGGIRGLLVQAAHPEVVAGVADHSRYREDPLGRLSRTSSYVTATTFGAMPEVEAAVAAVRRAHRPVEGTSHRGKSYSADAPALAAWVHNALTDSFLTAFQTFGPRKLTEAEADRFVSEQAQIGRLLDADPLPVTAKGLAEWVAGHPAVGSSPGQEEAVDFLANPPLSTGQRLGYAALLAGAVETLPVRIRMALGLSRRPAGDRVGAWSVAGLRWALGSSPTWRLALLRAGADGSDDARFKQDLPVELVKR